MAKHLCVTPQRWPMAFTTFIATLLLPVALALAVPMHNDPNGFEGIPWGAAFSESDTFVKVEDAGRVQTYELKSTTQTLGPAAVDSMKFSTIDHDRILSYLQQQFGPLDRTPGQVAGGAVKFFNWQGTDSEIILRYDLRTSQGVIFFESEAFRAKFNEGNSPSTF